MARGGGDFAPKGFEASGLSGAIDVSCLSRIG